MANWRMEFKTRENNASCVVSISGMAESKVLVPADNPLTTQTDDSDDFFKAVRGETGYIRVIAESDELNPLFNSAVTDHIVSVTVGGSLRWLGYVKQESYQQPILFGKNEIEIPIVGILEAMYGIYPQSLNGVMSLQMITRTFVQEIGMMSAISQYIYSSSTPPSVVFKKYINTDVWKENGEFISWGEIWEDICNAYGWQMCQDAGALCWLRRDVNNGAMVYTNQAGLSAITPSETAMPLLSMGLGELGKGHSVGLVQGKKSVRVEGKVGDGDEVDIYKLNIEKMKQTEDMIAMNTTVKGSTRQWNYYFFAFGLKDGPLTCMVRPVSASNPITRPMYQKFSTWNSDMLHQDEFVSTPNGSSIEVMDLGTSLWNIEDDGDRTTYAGITLLPMSASSVEAFRITSDSIMAVDMSSALSIEGRIKRIKSWEDREYKTEEVNPTMDLVAQIKYGDYYLTESVNTGKAKCWVKQPATVTIHVEEGQIKSFPRIVRQIAYRGYMTKIPGAAVILPPGVSAPIEIIVTCPTDYQNTVAYVIEQLEVNVVRRGLKYDTTDEENGKDSNAYEQIIGKGNSEEVSISTNLTIQRNDQYGNGIVLDAPTVDTFGDNIYTFATSLDGSGDMPEEQYCNRIKQYYSTSSKTIKIARKGWARTVAKVGDTLTDGKTYAIIAQSIDWRTMDNTITCLELKN